MQVSNFLRAHPRLVWAAQLLLALAAAAVGWLQLERSAWQENHVLLALAPQYILLGVLTVFAVPAVVYALCGRWHIATAAGGAAVTVLALVNYYVKMLHGTALLLPDLANVVTAADDQDRAVLSAGAGRRRGAVAAGAAGAQRRAAGDLA